MNPVDLFLTWATVGLIVTLFWRMIDGPFTRRTVTEIILWPLIPVVVTGYFIGWVIGEWKPGMLRGMDIYEWNRWNGVVTKDDEHRIREDRIRRESEALIKSRILRDGYNVLSGKANRRDVFAIRNRMDKVIADPDKYPEPRLIPRGPAKLWIGDLKTRDRSEQTIQEMEAVYDRQINELTMRLKKSTG